MSLNLLEPILDESLSEEAQDDDVLHTFCGWCFENDTTRRMIAHCVMDVTDETQLYSWKTEDECAMCVYMLDLRGWKCVNGHVQRP